MARFSSSSNAENVSKESEDETGKHPADKANWLSFATFFWMGHWMDLANKEGLKDTDIPEISDKESCKRNTDLLEQLWAREVSFADSRSSSRPSFAKVAWQLSRRRIFIASAFYITSLVLGFITPTILMRKVIGLATHPELKVSEAIKWFSLLILCELARVLFFTLTWAMSYRTAIRLKTASMGLVYRKLLRIGNLNDRVSSKLLNVISGDCARLSEVILSGQVSIGGPVVMIMCAVYIWHELGLLSLLGLLTFVLAYPLQYFIARGSGSMKRKAVRVKDERVSLISQVIQHFKFLKMFCWESFLFDTISDVREKERKYIVKAQFLQSFGVVLGPSLPHVAAIITFLIYICTGNNLHPAQGFTIIIVYTSRVRPTFQRVRAGFKSWFDASIGVSRIQAFTTVFIFSLLFFSIRMTNTLYDSFYSFGICCDRMKSLLSTPESNDPNGNICITNHAAVDEAIVIEDLRFTRHGLVDPRGSTKSLNVKEKKEKKSVNSIERLLGNSNDENTMTFQLGPINLNVKKGSLVGICGYIGSGKTTLLETIAGSMITDKGTLNFYGRTAYVPQHPWLFKGTLRENIIFGEPFDSVRYYSTIESCCLVNDFAILPIGDLTRVDNNAMNLSGGQRQRISLARALYYPSGDIYLLDDPLSGLDNRVAKTVFENAIMTKLRNQNKTILFATHQLHFLKECDEILVFSDGKIVQRGTHEELASMKDSIYNTLWATSSNFSGDNEQILMEDSQMLDIKQDTSVINTSSKKFQLEKSSKDVSTDVYRLYIQSAGGWAAFALVFTVFALSSGSTAFSSWWLKNWFRPEKEVQGESIIRDEYISYDSPNFIFNRDVYAGLIAAIFVTSIFRSMVFVTATMKAAKYLHRGILRQFFCNKMRTLEKIGSGQIFNLFARDMDEIDFGLPSQMENFLQNTFFIVSILVVISTVFPMFLIFAAVMAIVFSYYRRIYNTAIRDLKRIESRRRSPIFNRISETVKGLGTIRAFNKERMMTEEFEKLTDASCAVTYTFNASVRWLGIRLDILAVFITGAVAALIFTFHGTISASSAGLALAYAAQLSGVFQLTVRLASETEAKFVSVERMQTFLSYDTEELKMSNDKPEEVPRSDDGGSSQIIFTLPRDIHPNWPTMGHVKFDAVTMCYSTNDPPVLHDVSFEVQAGMNIGIIGRTGSGKSSIGNALFRLNQLKSGQIFIDGVDIATIPLTKLRNSMCVIPQDSAVFHKTVRFNLDAGKQYHDHELWSVLEKTGLISSIESLDSEVGLSHGQKQLFCIARAILRQSKIVFIDEATSNMDTETTAIVEKLIADEFKYSTVLIVAHRTSALSSCDNILIMGDGQIRDFGPADILSKKPEFRHSFETFESAEVE